MRGGIIIRAAHNPYICVLHSNLLLVQISCLLKRATSCKKRIERPICLILEFNFSILRLSTFSHRSDLGKMRKCFLSNDAGFLPAQALLNRRLFFLEVFGSYENPVLKDC